MIKIMKNLNNRGLTAIEILVCFSIVIVIVMSMFKVINNQKDKQTIESYKNSITTYKNSVTKTIEDDIRTGNGIKTIDAVYEDVDAEGITIAFTLINEEKREIRIQKKVECDDNSADGFMACESYNFISYTTTSSTENFAIPDIYNLKFNKVDITADDGYLEIYVGFDHPDLGKKYSAFELIDPIGW